MFIIHTHMTLILSVLMLSLHETITTFLTQRYVECGRYGFTCEGSTKLRLCEENGPFGPIFSCPTNTVCNEESRGVCEDNSIDPSQGRTLRCQRYERVADTSVPGCKGYILCIPNNNKHFQGIKFKCSGKTVFNGITRTCTTPDKYKCPLYESQATTPKLFYGQNDPASVYKEADVGRVSTERNRPIDCKSYKLVVTQDKSPARAAYFCPRRPVSGETKVRCTVFSNQFCITLEREDPDQFMERAGAAYRKPRLNNFANSNIYL